MLVGHDVIDITTNSIYRNVSIPSFVLLINYWKILVVLAYSIVVFELYFNMWAYFRSLWNGIHCSASLARPKSFGSVWLRSARTPTHLVWVWIYMLVPGRSGVAFFFFCFVVIFCQSLVASPRLKWGFISFQFISFHPAFLGLGRTYWLFFSQFFFCLPIICIINFYLSSLFAHYAILAVLFLFASQISLTKPFK